MGIKVKNPKKVDKAIEDAFNKWYHDSAVKLAKAGELLVQKAISEGNYIDQTGNLRSSIGYLVTKDNQVFEQYFSGNEAGKITQEKAYNHARGRKGIVLIVIAGMNYATYVESRGYNVITSAEMIADRLITELLEDENSI